MTFRLPRSTYLVVLFLLFGAVPLAFTESGAQGAPAVLGPRLLFLVIPVLATVFIARTGTRVSADGITVRALFGSRRLPWEQVQGLSVQRRNVYAVVDGGAVRLPCVRVASLGAVARASGGRLPAIADPLPKFARSRRRR